MLTLAGKKRKKNKAASDQASAPTAHDSADADPKPVIAEIENRDWFSAKPWLVGMLVIAATWWAALSLLTLTSANPTTVNQQQIRNSATIVRATVDDPAAGTVTVTRQWKDATSNKQIVISGLDAFEVKAGDDIVLPLTAGSDGTFELTRVGRAQRTYIYPATDEVLQQVNDIITPGDEQP